LSVSIERLPAEGDRGPPNNAVPSDASAGLTLSALDGAVRRKLDAPSSLEGVVVVAVKPGSAAARAGLEPEDVVVQAGGKPLRKPQELSERIREGGEALALLVWRNRQTFFAVLKP
jgi:serine protease Do